jgi:N-acetylneuraminic acid mutarotase
MRRFGSWCCVWLSLWAMSACGEEEAPAGNTSDNNGEVVNNGVNNENNGVNNENNGVEPECDGEERRCVNVDVEVCAFGRWTSLGACPSGTVCSFGDCVASCEADCTGRECGDDGCGGQCGSCEAGRACDLNGLCAPIPASCGDGSCQEGSEDCATCPSDCGRCCGDGACSQSQGEDCASCLLDCGCEDGERCDVQARSCACAPDCAGRACGDDGCGGQCGACDEGALCDEARGQCEVQCVAQCDGRACGDDGCGGDCGECEGAQICNGEGACVAPPADCGDDVCEDGEEDCATCPADCGQCCGDGACAASQGENCATCLADCGCPSGQECSPTGRVCECARQCSGRECGDDGCGGQCGACGQGELCDEARGQCEAQCVAQCEGRACGPDGCGGDCGDCVGAQVCNEQGACVAPPASCGDRVCSPGEETCLTCPADCGRCCGDDVCVVEHDEDCASCPLDCGCGDDEACSLITRQCECAPQCDGRECGDDGCGGQCGACAGDEACNVISGRCEEICQPACGARRCGDDGCGGSCGDCRQGEICRDDGVCVREPVACNCEPGQVCLDEICRDADLACSPRNQTGLCENGQICFEGACVASGAGCSRDNPAGVCPVGQLCRAGACEGVDDVALCDDGNACTADRFDALRNRCVYTAQQAACSDGNACTQDVCQAGACVGSRIQGCVEPPQLGPYTSPTNQGAVQLTGTKPAGSLVQVNNQEAVPESPEQSWSITLNLSPGTNRYRIRSVDGGQASAEVEVVIVFDIDPPTTRLSPAGGIFLGGVTATAATDEPATVYFTTDGSIPDEFSESFTSVKQFRVFDSTVLRFKARDQAGNWEEGVVSGSFEITGEGSAWSGGGSALPEALTLVGAATLDGDLFVVGGTDGVATQAGAYGYDPDNDAWVTLPSLPRGRAEVAVVGDQGALYAIGGQDEGTPLNAMMRLRPSQDDAWQAMAPMPSTRFGAAAAVVSGRIYVLGGKANGGAVLTNLEIYDPSTNTWTNQAQQMPRARYAFGAVAVGTRIFVMGGEDEDGNPVAAVDVYDTGANSWSMAAPMPTPRSFLGVFGLTNIGDINGGWTGIVAAGGRGAGGVASAKVEEYIVEDNAWRERTPLPQPRVGAAPVAMDRPGLTDTRELQGWLVGGQVAGDLVGSILRYRATQDFARRLADLPEPRFLHNAVALDGRLYIVGGRGFQEDRVVWAFDPETEEFVEVAQLPSFQNNAGAAAWQGRLYVFGGRNNFGNPVATTRAYDPATDTWEELRAMPTARSAPAVALSQGRMYVIGGDNGGAVQSVEIYDPASNTWSAAATLPEGRSGAFATARRGVIYLFGGYGSDGMIKATTYQLPMNNTWRTLANGPALADSPAAQSYDGQVVFFGGRAAEGVSRQIWRYDLNTTTRTLLATGLSVGRDKLTAAALYGKVYLLGGNSAANSEAPGEVLAQKLRGSCFNGLMDGRELGVDEGGGCAQRRITYSQSFPRSNLATNSPQCTSWNTFRASLVGNFSEVRMYGSLNPTGVSCRGAAANQICDALRRGVALNVACDGQTWTVSPACGSGVELTVGGSCSCSNAATVRPCIGNDNWGGIGSTTCSANAQTLSVECR